MVIDRDPEPTSNARRWRWLPLGSVLFATAGVVVLAGSLLSPPLDVMEATVSSDWHSMPSPGEALIVSGLAVHPGPEAATLAAELDPVIAPAALRAIAAPIAATPTGLASPGADDGSP